LGEFVEGLARSGNPIPTDELHPVVFGHEFCGEVLEHGSRSDRHRASGGERGEGLQHLRRADEVDRHDLRCRAHRGGEARGDDQRSETPRLLGESSDRGVVGDVDDVAPDVDVRSESTLESSTRRVIVS